MRKAILILALLALTSTTAGGVTIPVQDDPLVTSQDGIDDIITSLKEPKVLMIGLDGIRPDALQIVTSEEGSALGALMEDGAWSMNARTGNIAYSGPSWSSYLTGVWCDKHLVLNNSFSVSNYSDNPHVLTRMRQVDPDLKTASLVSWWKLNEYVLGAGNASIIETVETESAELDGDMQVRNRTVEILRDDDEIDAVFAYMGHTDTTGHAYGFSPDVVEYVDAIRRVDEMVGEMVAAIDERSYRESENWLIIVSTDHGGGGVRIRAHSPSSEIDRTTFLIVSGEEATQGELATGPVIVDVTSTALLHMGIDIDPAWRLDGQAVGHLRATQYESREMPFCVAPDDGSDDWILYIVWTFAGLPVIWMLWSNFRDKRAEGETLVEEKEETGVESLSEMIADVDEAENGQTESSEDSLQNGLKVEDQDP